MGDKWGGELRLTPQLRRDLLWHTQAPNHTNGKNLYRPAETTYIHCDNSCYGWGAVLYGKLEARGCWRQMDENHHIT
jgi:hypothetical protein